jgi:hypothetical protein
VKTAKNGEVIRDIKTTSAREFVRAWQSSSSVAEVSSKIQSSKNAVRVRAHRYRQLGVPLKVFATMEFESIDWDSLAEYAKSLNAGHTGDAVPVI